MLFQYEPEEFWKKIRELIREELQRLNQNKEVSYHTPGLTQKPVFRAAELCKLLNVTRQTLHMWNKEGLLKPHKIKSRTYYLWADLEKLIGLPKG